jgi:hypothetical protein
MATTTANNILSATENYGKAQTAFSIAMAQAANQREQAMIGLGADFTTQGGNVITPNEGGVALGGAGLPTGTAIRTGFGEGALPTIAKTQAGAVYQQEQALLEKGVGGGSGVTGQAKLITQDQGALETQGAIQDFQGKVAEANVAQGAAKLDLATAAGDLATAQEKKLPVGGSKKPVGGGKEFIRIGTPGGTKVPKKPKGGQKYTGPGGVTWQYRINGPKGKGWYK